MGMASMASSLTTRQFCHENHTVHHGRRDRLLFERRLAEQSLADVLRVDLKAVSRVLHVLEVLLLRGRRRHHERLPTPHFAPITPLITVDAEGASLQRQIDAVLVVGVAAHEVDGRQVKQLFAALALLLLDDLSVPSR